MSVRPILRWAGSKKKLLPQLSEHIPRNYNRYFEPFAGSACLFFHLTPNEAVIGDYNEEVIHLYRVVKRAYRKVGAALHEMPTHAEHYYALRATDPTKLSAVERAVRFLYLNRFCFNGVYRTNRTGAFNVPRGTHTGSIPSVEDVVACGKALGAARLVAGDFLDTLADAQPDDFVYVDPPYAKVGRVGYGEYGYGAFEENDCPRLVTRLRELHEQGTYVLFSYSDNESTRSMFADWDIRSLSVRRHVSGFASGRGLVTECLISNARLLGACS